MECNFDNSTIITGNWIDGGEQLNVTGADPDVCPKAPALPIPAPWYLWQNGRYATQAAAMLSGGRWTALAVHFLTLRGLTWTAVHQAALVAAVRMSARRTELWSA